MRVFVAGATGVVGRPLVAQLLDAGHEVYGLVRDRPDRVRDLGAEPVLGDALDRDSVVRAITEAKPDAVVHQLTAIPDRIDPKRIAEVLAPTHRLRTEGTENLMAGAVAAGARRFVSQSISFAYAPGEGLADEDEPLFVDAPEAFRSMIEALVALDRITLHTEGVQGVVLRYGLFYGPGTALDADGSMARDIRARRMPRVGSGDAVFSMIHVDDAAAAAVAAVESDVTGVFNIVDDDPTRAAEFLIAVAEILGAPRPWWVPAWLARLVAGRYAVYLSTAMRGASNARAKRDLGWSPTHSSWRDGLEAG